VIAIAAGPTARTPTTAKGYAMVMTLAINLISELNHPRSGLINLNSAERKIENLRELVK